MQHKILIVDDEPTITDTLKGVLSHEPYGILCAGSAEEALPHPGSGANGCSDLR